MIKVYTERSVSIHYTMITASCTPPAPVLILSWSVVVVLRIACCCCILL